MRTHLCGLIVLAVLLAGCSGAVETPPPPVITPGPANTPAPDAPPTPSFGPTSRADMSADLFCPTNNEEARRFFNEAHALQEQGDLEGAERGYLRAIELDPAFCDAMDNLGLALRHLGRVDEAISWYERSLEVFPGNTVAIQNLGAAYQVQDRFQEAISQYERLVQIAPDNPEGYFGIGTCYVNLTQYDKAIPYLEQAATLYEQEGSPYLIDAQYYLGMMYFFQEDCQQVVAILEPVYDQLANDANANYFLGVCYLEPELRDVPVARAYILKAQELGADIPGPILRELEEGQ